MGLRWQIQEHCITGIMKLLLLFAAIGYTSAAVTCDECKDAAAGLVDRLTSEASIAEQTEVLIAASTRTSLELETCARVWVSARRDQCSPSLRTGPVRSALQSWRGSAPS